MSDLQHVMGEEDWCVLAYRALGLIDPRAHLEVARLYRKSGSIKDNMHYALFWLVMAREFYVRQQESDVIFMMELSGEIHSVTDELGDEKAKDVIDFVEFFLQP